MPKFEQLFGVAKKDIRPTCILTPFLAPEILEALAIREVRHGSPFTCALAEQFTLIHTQIGAPFVGDAVLHLADSPCHNMIFVGACGAVDDAQLSIGSVVIAESAANLESFSALLTKEPHPDQSGHANQDLVAALQPQENQLPKVNCASLGSFYLEESCADYLKEHGFDIMQMETCAFYEAARHTLRRAVALLYVSDILLHRQAFDPLTPAQQAAVTAAQQRIFRIISEALGRIT